MNARQPPNVEMSRAPSTSTGSTRNPLTPRPSARRTVPIDSGGGIAATNLPNAGCGQCPELDRDRRTRARRDAQHAGLWRRRADQRIELVVRRGAGGFQQASTERLQFAVQRHARQMRADHGDGDFVAGERCGQGRERRLRQASRAHREFGVGMEDAADAGQLRVLSGRCQQRDAERDVVGPDRRRQCEAAEVEQIDEVGVGAEPGVEFDRIGQHLRGRVGGRRGRQHQRVDVGEGALGDLAQRLQR